MCKILEEEREQGMERGIRAFICDNREENIQRERVLVKLQKSFELSEDEAEMWLEKYWG